MNYTQESKRKEIVSWIKTIVIPVIFAFVITRFVILNAKIPSGSMSGTIMPNDRLIAFRQSYLFSEVKRGDIIVFPFPDNEEDLYVKRVIGLPNETVEIIDGKVYIDGELLIEDYVSSEITNKTRNSGPYIVPENKVFVLGDNRKYSIDARYWKEKYVDIDKVIGKPIFRYYPNISLIN